MIFVHNPGLKRKKKTKPIIVVDTYMVFIYDTSIIALNKKAYNLN